VAKIRILKTKVLELTVKLITVNTFVICIPTGVFSIKIKKCCMHDKIRCPFKNVFDIDVKFRIDRRL
jgi:hypothetical protein